MNYDNWAKVYDLIYGSNKDDVNFYQNEAKKVKGKVLEIGCGTGRIYLELLKEGVDAYGIDLSPKMLESLKEKAKKLGLKPKIKKTDMKSFKLRNKFSLIIIPFRAFLHNLTTEDQIQTLKNIKRHLPSNGRLILNFFFPNYEIMASHYNKQVKRNIKTKSGNLLLYEKARFADEPNQIINGTTTILNNNKKIWSGKVKLALVYKKEFELLLRSAGFKKWKVYGGFDYQPLKSSKQEMVWLIQN